MWDFFNSTTSLISLRYIILILFVSFLTIFAARVINRLMLKFFTASSKHLKVDASKYAFSRHLTVALIYLLGIGIIVYTIPQLRALSVTLFAGAGILAVIVGFASQQAFANIVSGIFIVIFKPFKVDDWVSIDVDTFGVIEDITLRHTVIRNPENKRFVIPNSIISETKIENADFADKKVCRLLNIGIGYDSDINKAINIIRDEAEKHPDFYDNRNPLEKKQKVPAVLVRVINLGESSVDLRAWVWAKDRMTGYNMKCDLLKSIKERFDKEGVEIPFPHRTVVEKKRGKVL